MLDSVMSAGSTSSATAASDRRPQCNSLADELDKAFFSPVDHAFVVDIDSPRIDDEKVEEGTGQMEEVDLEEREQPPISRSRSESLTITSTDSDSPTKADDGEERLPAAEVGGDVKKSDSVQHSSSEDSLTQPKQHDNRLLALKHNRVLIERKANGLFDMATMPSECELERHVQQLEGIAALQRTLIPATGSNTASSSTNSSHGPSSMAVSSVKRPSGLQKITVAEPRDRRPRNASP